jgi:hypothetical protein
MPSLASATVAEEDEDDEGDGDETATATARGEHRSPSIFALVAAAMIRTSMAEKGTRDSSPSHRSRPGAFVIASLVFLSCGCI